MMSNIRITPAQKLKVLRLHSEGHSTRAIGHRVGIHDTTVGRIINAAKEALVEGSAARIETDIRALLKRAPMTPSELAIEMGSVKVGDIRATLDGMISRGAMLIKLPGGAYDLSSSALLPPGRFEVDGADGEWTHAFGITTDNHLCNKHSRLDVLNAAYDHFERDGISTVFNAGNWIDGEARFNKTELVTAPGMDSQLDYMIDKWPVRKGIITHYIAGDDHEGWYSQREGIEIGKYLELRAREQGRDDLHYLGYAECDVALKFGRGAAVARVVHPGGGSAYAVSYTDQKRTESYQGGEKPQVEFVGHYHKFNHGYPREVHTVQCGCTCDQTLFMRKKRIQAHVGYNIVRIKQDSTGIITRFAVEWFPFFDRGFYEKRFR